MAVAIQDKKGASMIRYSILLLLTSCGTLPHISGNGNHPNDNLLSESNASKSDSMNSSIEEKSPNNSTKEAPSASSPDMTDPASSSQQPTDHSVIEAGRSSKEDRPSSPELPAKGAESTKPVDEGLIIYEDFEAVAVGELPNGPLACFESLSDHFLLREVMSVVDTKSFTGKKSLHITNGPYHGVPIQLSYPISPPLDHFYVKVNMMLSVQLGYLTTDPFSYQYRMLLINFTGGTPDISSPRCPFTGGLDTPKAHFGSMFGTIGTHLNSTTRSFSPKKEAWGKGPVIPANEWFCVTIEVDSRGEYGKLVSEINGKIINEIAGPEQWEKIGSHAIPGPDWLKPTMSHVGFGLRNESQTPQDVWIDKIVISKNKPTCD
jgi:hypothetical protein